MIGASAIPTNPAAARSASAKSLLGLRCTTRATPNVTGRQRWDAELTPPCPSGANMATMVDIFLFPARIFIGLADDY